MNCPKCGAAVQPYDRFCIRCGHDMQPAGAAGRGQTTARPSPYSPGQSQGSAGSGWGASPQTSPAPGGQSPYGGAAPQQPFDTQARNGAGATWASGSSTPGPNPYAGGPSTVSGGTMLNGRPAAGGQNRGLLQGLGAAVVAFFVILGKAGGLVAGLGIFKLLFYWWLFSGLLHAGIGTLILVVIVLLIVGAIARNGRVT